MLKMNYPDSKKLHSLHMNTPWLIWILCMSLFTTQSLGLSSAYSKKSLDQVTQLFAV